MNPRPQTPQVSLVVSTCCLAASLCANLACDDLAQDAAADASVATADFDSSSPTVGASSDADAIDSGSERTDGTRSSPGVAETSAVGSQPTTAIASSQPGSIGTSVVEWSTSETHAADNSSHQNSTGDTSHPPSDSSMNTTALEVSDDTQGATDSTFSATDSGTLGVCGPNPCRVTCRAPELYPGLESDTCLVTCIGNQVVRGPEHVAEINTLGCEVIQGSVSFLGEAVDSLTGLEKVRRISYGMEFSKTALTDLWGLDNLEELGSSLRLSENPSLTALDALTALRSVGAGNVTIQGNPALVNLEGLSNAVFGEIALAVTYNDVLRTLRGLEGITVSHSVQIVSNRELTSFDGLQNLTAAGSMYATQNGSLQRVLLPSLEDCGQRLHVSSNASLEAWQAPLLRSVSELQVGGNANLRELELPSLITADSLVVSLNPRLPHCIATNLSQRTGAGCTCEGNDTNSTCD